MKSMQTCFMRSLPLSGFAIIGTAVNPNGGTMRGVLSNRGST
jgi:hypothetical protein